MAITADAPRGGVVEQIGDATYTLLLRNREIERFEDRHRGIFELWDGFFDRGQKPTTKEVRNLLAYALVGGGLSDAQADAVIGSGGPDQLMRYYELAHAVLGVAFMPDVFEEPEVKKKTKAGQSPNVLTSAGLSAVQ
jgi:hypothetical protein